MAKRHPYLPPGFEEIARMAEQHQRMLESILPAIEIQDYLASSGFDRMVAEAAAQTKQFEQLGAITNSHALDLADSLSAKFFELHDAGFLGGVNADMWRRQITGFQLPEHYTDVVANFKSAFEATRFDDILQMRAVLDDHTSDAVRHLLSMIDASAIVSPASWSGMQATFDHLHRAYDRMLLDPLTLQLPQVADLKLPEITVNGHASLIVSFEQGEAEQELPLSVELANKVPFELLPRLRTIVPRHAAMFEGALGLLGSNDVNAATTALGVVRKTLFALIKKLAPEKKVRAWARELNDPEFFKDGKIGEKNETSYYGRFLYLSRADLKEKNSPYARYLKQDAKSLVTFIDILSKELHDEEDEPLVLLPPYRVQKLLYRASALFAELIVCAHAQEEMERRKNDGN